MTAVLAAYHRGFYAAPKPSGAWRAVEAAVGVVATGVTILPAYLGFAAPVRRGAVVVVWLKAIGGILICGAMLALANWVYTLCANQWLQTGLPPLPPMAVKPGGGEIPLASPQNASIPLGASPVTQAQKPQASWLDEYQN